jgi:hypothetical protein
MARRRRSIGRPREVSLIPTLLRTASVDWSRRIELDAAKVQTLTKDIRSLATRENDLMPSAVAA